MGPEELYRAAVKKWGPNSQKDMAIEEMAELIDELILSLLMIKPLARLSKELSHDKRGRTHCVEEELADVILVTEQIYTMYDGAKVDRIKAEKLKRFEGLLNDKN